MKKPRITVIGGGTGIPVILRSLRHKDVDITAVVTVADDGGSSGDLREDVYKRQDYHCDWCDSAFTWDGSEKPTRMTADEVIEALDALGTYDYVTLSGGNPALLAANMAELVSKLKARGVTLAVETQGSRSVSYTHLSKNINNFLRSSIIASN